MDVSISNVHMHPTWNEEKYLEAKGYLDKNGTQHNGTGDLRDLGVDIAVVKLDSEVTFSYKIRPVCLPANANNRHIGESAVAAGWGHTDNPAYHHPTAKPGFINSSITLLETPVKILPNDECNKVNRSGYYESIHLCVEGAFQTWKGPRSGDSGGPLNFLENGRFTVHKFKVLNI